MKADSNYVVVPQLSGIWSIMRAGADFPIASHPQKEEVEYLAQKLNHWAQRRVMGLSGVGVSGASASLVSQ